MGVLKIYKSNLYKIRITIIFTLLFSANGYCSTNQVQDNFDMYPHKGINSPKFKARFSEYANSFEIAQQLYSNKVKYNEYEEIELLYEINCKNKDYLLKTELSIDGNCEVDVIEVSPNSRVETQFDDLSNRKIIFYSKANADNKSQFSFKIIPNNTQPSLGITATVWVEKENNYLQTSNKTLLELRHVQIEYLQLTEKLKHIIGVLNQEVQKASIVEPIQDYKLKIIRKDLNIKLTMINNTISFYNRRSIINPNISIELKNQIEQQIQQVIAKKEQLINTINDIKIQSPISPSRFAPTDSTDQLNSNPFQIEYESNNRFPDDNVRRLGVKQKSIKF